MTRQRPPCGTSTRPSPRPAASTPRSPLPLDRPGVTRSPGGWARPTKTFALGLGCELRHAGRLVYSAGLDLGDETAATPIGLGCKVCDRPACPQRSAPAIGRPLAVDGHTSTFVPYPAVPAPRH